MLFLQRHNLKNFKSNFLKFDKKHYKGIDTLQLKKFGDCGNIHSANPLFLLVNFASGYIEEKHENKNLIFDDSANENKWLLKKIRRCLGWN